MEAFPIIHTNFWDAVIAVPVVIFATQILKILLHPRKACVPGIANLIGLIISIFIAHPHNLWAGVFMGFFYGNAAVGVYSSLKVQILAYRDVQENS
ncbi:MULTISPECIES: hypothetical protein [unclassified Mesobacillus]|uniref:hypothetical protein n=1 Tax=unclassified Mesobacillus TaxID=2675270 RepID=UPI00203CD486|nr:MULTISPECIES: hypothetical protein [unclassified Mesobacillus]MCM3123046.1 hypothetical protein [Mesobacillus sp. MER 33]MCM3233471.1 hypothetical protein [Mesobacillus sp. MER 48]